MSITVRPAQGTDAEGVVSLLCDIADLHHNGRPDIFRSGFSKYDIPEYLQLLEREDAYIFVADGGNGEVLGYAIAFYNDFGGDKAKYPCRYLYLDDLCVSEKCRKGGIGKALMDRVEEQARALGCEKIELNVWNFKGNALAFYEKCGYSAMYTKMDKIIK